MGRGETGDGEKDVRRGTVGMDTVGNGYGRETVHGVGTRTTPPILTPSLKPIGHDFGRIARDVQQGFSTIFRNFPRIVLITVGKGYGREGYGREGYGREGVR